VDVTAAVQGLTKIDYVDGLGIAIGAQDISFVHVKKRFLRVSVLQARFLPLPSAEGERAEAIERALIQFLQELPVSPDQIVLCLPRHHAFVSRLVIPETARSSLAQVIEYEIERLVPLPKDEIYHDCLTHEIGGEERRLSVVILAVPRRIVDEHLAILERAQLRPQMVTLSSAALMSAATFCVPFAEGPNVLVAKENGSVELSFVEKKHLIASHLFSQAHARSEAVLTDLIAQGITRNLPGATVEEVPIFVWPGDGTLPLPASPEHDLYALAVSRFAMTEAEAFPSASLPALGAALQAVGEDVVGINLLPPEKRARREKVVSPLTLVLLGLIFVLTTVWPVSVLIQQHRMLRIVSQREAELDPSVRQVQEHDNEAKHLLERLKLVDESTQKRVVPLLKNLSEVIPTDVYVTSFRYKDGDVEISGVAAASRPASELVGLLEGSPCLRNVAPKAPFTKTAQGETFTLGAQVEPCV
jgi:Tfp pilus assembly protein PilN